MTDAPDAGPQPDGTPDPPQRSDPDQSSRAPRSTAEVGLAYRTADAEIHALEDLFLAAREAWDAHEIEWGKPVVLEDDAPEELSDFPEAVSKLWELCREGDSYVRRQRVELGLLRRAEATYGDFHGNSYCEVVHQVSSSVLRRVLVCVSRRLARAFRRFEPPEGLESFRSQKWMMGVEAALKAEKEIDIARLSQKLHSEGELQVQRVSGKPEGGGQIDNRSEEFAFKNPKPRRWGGDWITHKEAAQILQYKSRQTGTTASGDTLRKAIQNAPDGAPLAELRDKTHRVAKNPRTGRLRRQAVEWVAQERGVIPAEVDPMTTSADHARPRTAKKTGKTRNERGANAE